jgi:hypothetical protein
MSSASANWLLVQGVEAPELAQQLSAEVRRKIEGGVYTEDFVKVVAKISPGVMKRSLRVNAQQLESLRRLCQIWDVDVKPLPITSHRKFIGPVIVAVKRLVFPILKLFLRDSLRQQRDFNAQTIALLMELCQDTQGGRTQNQETQGKPQ